MSVPEESSPIIIEDENLRDGFTQIPNVVLRDPTVSPGAKVAYAVLLSYAWEKDRCFPGQQTMASDMGSGERSVRRYMQELAASGLIEITHRGLGKSNLYIIKRLRPAILADATDVDITRRNPAKMAATDRPKSTATDRPKWPTKNTQIEEDEKKKTKKGTRVPRAAASGGPSPTPPIEKVLIETPVAISDGMIRAREASERQRSKLRAGRIEQRAR
jgi:hypothetical protein